MGVAKLAQRVVGSGTGPRTLLVCAHANGFCKELWLPVWQSLHARLGNEAGEVHAIALDLPGHGDAEPFVPPLEIGVLSRAVIDAMERYMGQSQLTFDKVVGVGHSIGATSLLHAELSRPKSFDSLFLVEAILVADFPRGKENPISAMTLKRKAAFATREAAVENWQGKSTFAKWKPEILRLYAEAGLKKRAQGDFFLKCHPEQEAEVFRLSKSSVVSSLGSIQCPVTWLNALAPTGHVPAESAVERFRDFPQGRALVLLPHCSHFVPMEQPELVAEHLASHLSATCSPQLSPPRSHL